MIDTIDYLARVLRLADENQDAPEMTVRDLLHAMTWCHWHDQCRHCHAVVINFSGEAGFTSAPWYHATGARGCKAARYEALGQPKDTDPAAEALGRNRCMAAPHRAELCAECAANNILNETDPHSQCHVCQVKTELLKGRSGHGWDWS